MKPSKRKTLKIEIENLTEAQALAVEDLLWVWMSLGNKGSSRWTGFYADGDGDFQPNVKVNGRKPLRQSEIDPEGMWRDIVIKYKDYDMDHLAYMVDFDWIAKALRVVEEQKSEKPFKVSI